MIKNKQVLPEKNKSSSDFFKKRISQINQERVRLNRSKNIACFTVSKDKVQRNIQWIEPPLGVMSFSLYYLRLIINMNQLHSQIYTKDSNEPENKKTDLILDITNDLIWSTTNLVEFFWLSFKNSREMGLLGLQLEITAMALDLLLMIIRHQKAYHDYKNALSNASEQEAALLRLNWSYKQVNIMRSIIHISIMIGTLSTLIFVNLSTPISPVIYLTSLASNIIRLQWKWHKQTEIIQLMKRQNQPDCEIEHEEQLLSEGRMQDLNEILIYFVFLPFMLYLVFTASMLEVGLYGAGVIAAELLLKKYQNDYAPPHFKADKLLGTSENHHAEQDTHFAFLSASLLD